MLEEDNLAFWGVSEDEMREDLENQSGTFFFKTKTQQEKKCLVSECC